MLSLEPKIRTSLVQATNIFQKHYVKFRTKSKIFFCFSGFIDFKNTMLSLEQVMGQETISSISQISKTLC